MLQESARKTADNRSMSQRIARLPSAARLRRRLLRDKVRQNGLRKLSQEGFVEPLPKTMTVEEKLIAAGHRLPELPEPGGNYLSARTVGKLVYLAGVISSDENGVVTGPVDDIDKGYAAARLCALTQLAVLKRHLGSLEEVKSVVSVNGYVYTAGEFPYPPRVINGASDLLVAVFGDAGRHVRAAIGVSSLPRNALVELQMVVEIF
jgi:enamine deaminase RidA (YjgF/YER057c/UK114 family)